MCVCACVCECVRAYVCLLNYAALSQYHETDNSFLIFVAKTNFPCRQKRQGVKRRLLCLPVPLSTSFDLHGIVRQLDMMISMIIQSHMAWGRKFSNARAGGTGIFLVHFPFWNKILICLYAPVSLKMTRVGISRLWRKIGPSEDFKTMIFFSWKVLWNQTNYTSTDAQGATCKHWLVVGETYFQGNLEILDFRVKSGKD